MPAVLQQEIANGVAQVYKDLYGRGPQRVVAMILADAVLVVLWDVNTPGQKRLVDLDEIGLLNTVHSRVQRSIEPDLIVVVERVTGRTVDAYVSGYDGRRDIATDTFLLRPQPRD